MQLIVNKKKYRCTGKPSLKEPVHFNLPDERPELDQLGDVLTLVDNSDAVMATVNTADFSRWYYTGTCLCGSNTPEPTPTPTPDPEPSADDVLNVLLGVNA